MPCIFITGPVRSGKSRFAERLALERGGAVTYVATGRLDPDDREWSQRIAHHVRRRPAYWQTIETAREGAPSLEAIVRQAASERTLLIDSFGTWVASFMHEGIDATRLEARAHDAATALVDARAFAIVVGEEVGWGIVPDYPAGRLFRDVLGRAQARLAAGSTAAYLVVAGYALDLRKNGTAVDPG